MLNDFAFADLLFARAATFTIASCEIFLIPEYLKKYEIDSELRSKAKPIFTIYQIIWCMVVTILAMLPSASVAAYIDIAVMYGFTL